MDRCRWQRPGYGGRCPPIGRHRYFHKLYALDAVLPDLGRPTKAQLDAAMKGHVLASAELVGTLPEEGTLTGIRAPWATKQLRCNAPQTSG